MTADPCPRDWAGFCRLALWGWPKCFRGSDGDRCDERDPQGNLEAARARRIGALVAEKRENP